MTANPVTWLKDQPYPGSSMARERLRGQKEGEAIAEAKRTALYAYTSMKCSGRQGYGWISHAGQPDGCRNDGSTCLCGCHDG